jgi:hypothetical protein
MPPIPLLNTSAWWHDVPASFAPSRSGYSCAMAQTTLALPAFAGSRTWTLDRAFEAMILGLGS